MTFHMQRCRIALAYLLALGSTLLAHGRIPEDVPVERLVANLTKYIKEHPDDPEGYYRLGRVHTLALETKTEFVIAFEDAPLPRPAEGSWAHREVSLEKRPKKASKEQLVAHLKSAVQNLNRAIEIRPSCARYRLTLACALEAGASMMQKTDVWPLCPVPGALTPEDSQAKEFIRNTEVQFEQSKNDPKIIQEFIERLSSSHWSVSTRDVIVSVAYGLRDIPDFKASVEKLRQADWAVQIEDQYFTAMTLALPTDGKAEVLPIWGGLEDWVSYEAGKDFVRVVEARAARKSDPVRLKVAKAAVAAFEKLPPPSGITPLVLSFTGTTLANLCSDRTVGFDLDGTYREQRWTWVQPDTGILVWDPDCTGHITSGRQLFGSVSWWLFFDDGYQALDALDDDRDGELTGSELTGISVWFDRNSNGISDPGEVQPTCEIGISALSCRASSLDGNSPINLTGCRTADGRVLPTFDWISTSHPANGRSGEDCGMPLGAKSE